MIRTGTRRDGRPQVRIRVTSQKVGPMPRRVLLLFPQLNNLVFFDVYEPLVLEIFSAIAEEESCEAELVDLRLEPRGCERLAQRGYVPDLIALTTHGFPEVPIVNRIARTCKTLWPGSALVIGGGQATVTPELFDQSAVDLIVKGPGERLWRELCRTGVAAGRAARFRTSTCRASTAIRCPIGRSRRGTASTTRRGFRITAAGAGGGAAGPASRSSRKAVRSAAASA